MEGTAEGCSEGNDGECLSLYHFCFFLPSLSLLLFLSLSLCVYICVTEADKSHVCIIIFVRQSENFILVRQSENFILVRQRE